MDKTYHIDIGTHFKEKVLTSQAWDEQELKIQRILAQQITNSPYNQIQLVVSSTATENSAIYGELTILKEENTYLKGKMIEMGRKLDEVIEAIGTQKTIVLRQINRKEAKQEIKALFSSGETLYFSDIAERLRLDLEVVVEICKELAKEGGIEVDRSTL